MALFAGLQQILNVLRCLVLFQHHDPVRDVLSPSENYLGTDTSRLCL